MEIFGADSIGIDGHLIKLKIVKETDRKGIVSLGLASKIVKEGIARATKAIESLSGDWDVVNDFGYTIDLTPAEVPKNSSGLDLPIAIMLMQAAILQRREKFKEARETLDNRLRNPNLAPKERNKILEQREKSIAFYERTKNYVDRINKNINKYLLIGALDITNAKIETPQYGMLSLISAAKDNYTVIVPEEAETHAALVARSGSGITAIIASDLQEVWDILIGLKTPRKAHLSREKCVPKIIVKRITNFEDIEGVSKAKLAMKVAIAGGHNILLVGPPGNGKTMLSKAALNVMPALEKDEWLELNKIYSAKGELTANKLIFDRPYIEANNNTTLAALIGGGKNIPLPGTVSLAHKGILCFDEFNLCKSELIENLRVAMNSNEIVIQRLHFEIKYPCNFMLVAAMNPCKCGWYKHYRCFVKDCTYVSLDPDGLCEKHNKRLAHKCTCSQATLSTYKNKLSGPLLDRIDIKVFVSPFDNTVKELDQTSLRVKSEISKAYTQQRERYDKVSYIFRNADVSDFSELSKYDDLQNDVLKYWREISGSYNLTKRSEVKLLLVSRTIADLEQSSKIYKKHIDLAIDLMGINDEYFRNL